MCEGGFQIGVAKAGQPLAGRSARVEGRQALFGVAAMFLDVLADEAFEQGTLFVFRAITLCAHPSTGITISIRLNGSRMHGCVSNCYTTRAAAVHSLFVRERSAAPRPLRA